MATKNLFKLTYDTVEIEYLYGTIAQARYYTEIIYNSMLETIAIDPTVGYLASMYDYVILENYDRDEATEGIYGIYTEEIYYDTEFHTYYENIDYMADSDLFDNMLQVC